MTSVLNDKDVAKLISDVQIKIDRIEELLEGMDKPSLGEIDFGGQDLCKLNNDQLAIFRRKNCGFVFQQIYLLDNMSVLDNVLASGLLVNKNKREIVKKAKELLKQFGKNKLTSCLIMRR